MIAEAVREETRAVLAMIDASGMEPDRKSTLRRIVLHAEEGTNCLEPATKLQNVSETVFDLCLFQAFEMVDDDRAARGRAAHCWEVGVFM